MHRIKSRCGYPGAYSSINIQSAQARNSPIRTATRLQAINDENLYEILNSGPSSTRQELKKNYITLVRRSHPDALTSNGSVSTADSDDQFQRITSAWKILSNPLERKRYDRELRAQAFTQNVEDVVGSIATTAGPQFMKAFDNVAIPFLRRSAATTVAGFAAVTKDIQNYSDTKTGETNGGQNNEKGMETKANESSATMNSSETMGLGSILSNAVQASQKAGKAIDRLELNEKSNELSKRAKKEMREATRLRDKLDRVMRKRVQLLLHTPNAKLSSLEALIILDGFNIKDEVTMLDTVRLRKTVTQEIEWLEPLEQEVRQKQELDEKLEFDIERKSTAHEQAKVNSAAAIQAEERARKALEDAIALVDSTKVDVDNADNSLRNVVEEKKTNLTDLDRVKWNMERQQERVRLALRRKEQALQQNTLPSVLVPVDEDLEQGEELEEIEEEEETEEEMEEIKIIGDFNSEMASAAQAEVERLLKKERYLKAESARVHAKAESMERNAKKLLDRANELEEEEDKAYKALEEGLRVAKKAADTGYGECGIC
jgi:curved DNA-binding protein CbpA